MSNNNEPRRITQINYGSRHSLRGYWLTVTFENGRKDTWFRRSLQELAMKIEWLEEVYEVDPDADGPAAMYQ